MSDAHDDADSPESDDPLAWEITDSWVGYECPGFDIVHDEVRLPDGTETDYDYLVEPEAVVVLPFTRDGDVVVIEEWRHAVGRVNRGLPAGSVEEHDDDLAVAARRELTEETGYEADRVEHLTSVEPANGIGNSLFHYFVAYDCEDVGGQELDFNESIRVDTAEYDDLLAEARTGELRDGRAMTGLLYYELFGDDE
ncbi:NUDIX hydrolase [Haloarchaeobius sp. HME9146]|uniref:NUDIX hydrolase n=1 Tax=Haloarchaeobius sp. HME9146 TaxID=2978732 RepID=UPI0021C1294E|nr:NUDIX hydrolase [Haloarchaeobius sp. HME9146]MCT9097903.1 NUDIX hydrolase [Haloarchaeobius sp. HME9146]